MAVTQGSDAELLGRVRGGDDAALGDLYVLHRPAALRLARGYGAGPDAEDVVNEAFERVIAALRRGAGPDDAFRPYLFVTVRRLCAGRNGTDHDSLDEVPERVMAAEGAPLDLTDRTLVAEAFADLPDRWQTVLWHTAVEGRRPREVAKAVGMPANTVAVLAHRARERLRQRYLQAHLRSDCPPACAPHRARLGAHVRGGLTRRARGSVDDHLAHCSACRQLAADLDDVNRLLARAVAPLFVLVGGAGPPALAAAGGAATAGTAATGLGAGAAGGAGGGGSSTAASLASGGAAGGGSLGAAGSAIGIATAAKVAAVVAAVVGLGAVAPIDLGSGSEHPSAEVATPAADDRALTTTDRPNGPPTAAAPTGPAATGTAGSTGTTVPPATAAGSGAGDPVVGLDLEVGSGVGVDVTVAPLPGVAVDAQVGAGPTQGVTLDAAWRAGLLGAGTLAVDVANVASDALVGAAVVVDLSPGARPSSLLGIPCHATDPGLIGAVLSLLGSLTCDLALLAPSDDATLAVPLAVLGNGQTASVRVIAGGVELASTTIDLVG
jgi:RNA polymerase sigma factor (sigma-70 family)